MAMTTTILISRYSTRRGGEGFEHLKGKFLHGARLAGQLDQADGDGDRGILDGVEKFGRQRRHDDAKRHRQQHVAIGLRRRQSKRGRGEFLAARQRADAGAGLFGDARRHEQPDPDRRGVERRVGHLLQPQPPGRRQQFRQHEEPDETAAPAAACCGRIRRKRSRCWTPSSTAACAARRRTPRTAAR